MRRGPNWRLVRRDVMPTDSEFGQGRSRYDGPFHFSLPQKARLCNPYLQNEVSPFSQEGPALAGFCGAPFPAVLIVSQQELRRIFDRSLPDTLTRKSCWRRRQGECPD